MALPYGEVEGRAGSWPDWRRGGEQDLRERLDWPCEGVVFDVLNNDFWPGSWGSRPRVDAVAEQIARRRLMEVPTMVPLFGHRYLVADPAPIGAPVFSIWQTDVIYYGDDLLDYLAHDFEGKPFDEHPRTDYPRVPFWSDVVERRDCSRI